MGWGQLVWSPSPAAEPFSRREARAEGAVSGEYVHPARMCLSVLGLLSDERPRISSYSLAWLVRCDAAPGSETGQSTPAGRQSSASESCDPS